MLVLQHPGNGMGLVMLVGTKGAAVHFDKADDIRIRRFDELDNSVQIGVGVFEVAAVRNRKVKLSANSRCITNIVQEKSHHHVSLYPESVTLPSIIIIFPGKQSSFGAHEKRPSFFAQKKAVVPAGMHRFQQEPPCPGKGCFGDGWNLVMGCSGGKRFELRTVLFRTMTRKATDGGMRRGCDSSAREELL